MILVFYKCTRSFLDFVLLNDDSFAGGHHEFGWVVVQKVSLDYLSFGFRDQVASAVLDC